MRDINELIFSAPTLFWREVYKKIEIEGWAAVITRDQDGTIEKMRTYGLVLKGQPEVQFDFTKMRDVPDVQTREEWAKILKDAIEDALDTLVDVDYWMNAHFGPIFEKIETEVPVNVPPCGNMHYEKPYLMSIYTIREVFDDA